MYWIIHLFLVTTFIFWINGLILAVKIRKAWETAFRR